jgi:hypothetical protein
MWPFNKASQKPRVDSYPDYVTSEQFLRDTRCAQLTSAERAVVEQELSAFDGQMVHPQYAADMFGVFAAAGLAKYGLVCMSDAAQLESSAERAELLVAALSALQNANMIYPHPALKAHVADIFQAMGRAADTNRVRSEASREEATRTKKETDQMLLSDLTSHLYILDLISPSPVRGGPNGKTQ